MSEQNPDWSDTMEGHVVNFIIHTDMILQLDPNAIKSVSIICHPEVKINIYHNWIHSLS